MDRKGEEAVVSTPGRDKVPPVVRCVIYLPQKKKKKRSHVYAIYYSIDHLV